MEIRLGRRPKKDDDSNRDDWRKAIATVTSGQYRVGQKDFLAFEDMVDFLTSNGLYRSRANPLTAVTLSTPTNLYFTSFRRIGWSTYKGHIATIVGVDGSSMRRSGKRPPILLINSAAKGDDNECLPQIEYKKKYFGTSGWSDDYEIKLFDGKLILNWIERA
jgi:hypothetical protein